MSFWEPCWACRLVAGERCGEIVAETPKVIVAINPFATNPGHALIMPRRHIVNIYELPDSLAAPILAMAARVARAAKAAFRADGITLRQNNDPASDQHLFHFHLHVIPRHEGDRERFIADAPMATAEEQAEMARRLGVAL
jgi:histidine triad (HIT) family protein